MVCRSIDIELLEKQEEFVFSKAKIPAFIGGIGGGKTWAGAVKAIITALQNPDVVGLICANTYPQLMSYTVATFKDVLKRYKIGFLDVPSQKTIYVKAGAKTAVIHYRSTDKPHSIRGGTYGWAWLDEARDMKDEAFTIVLGRLRDPRMEEMRLWITSSPKGFNWIHKRFVKDPMPGSQLIQSTTKENLYLSDDYYQTLEELYDPLLAQQELDAIFLNILSGRVYHQFSRKLHVKDCILDNRYPVDWCLDFNVDPFATIIGQERDGISYATDEIVDRCGTIYDMIEEFKEKYPPVRCAGGLHIYADATARGATLHDGQSYLKILRQELKHYPGFRWKVRESNPRVTDRVNAVNARQRTRRGKLETSTIISPNCTNLIDDFEQVIKIPGTHKIDKSDGERTHYSDAWGYKIAFLHPLGDRPQIETQERVA